MFGKLASDLSGSSDVCTCVSRDGYDKVDSLSYLQPHEVPFIVLKSGKEEHIFTDHAYVFSKGESATSTRRLISRYSYFEHRFTGVMFETAGMGMSDRDVELKFTIGGHFVSIDIWKKEIQTAIVYYKALCAIASVQAKNATMVSLAKDAISKSNTGDVMQSIAWADAVAGRFAPENYGFIFAAFLQK
jgi:hypothetical protein